MSIAELVVGNEPDAVPRVRRFARSSLSSRPDELLADVELVVSELVTNATLHGAPPIVVRLGTVDDCIRVEVADVGRTLPVQMLDNPENTTGRGLSLVAALSRHWGIEPNAPVGKVVWAEICREQDSGVSPSPQMDEEAILASWPGLDDQADLRYTVRLGMVPTDFLLAAKAHIDSVVREMELMRGDSARTGVAMPPAVEMLIDTVTTGFAEARSEIKRQALDAAARGDRVTSLELHLPLGAAAAGEKYLAALDEADRFARSAHLLTLAAPPAHRLFRRWYVQSLVDQLRALAGGQTPTPPQPFAEELAGEVNRLAALEGLALRLAALEAVASRLAVAGTADEMASLVIDECARCLEVETIRVYLATDRGTLRSSAWYTPRRTGSDPDPYDEFSLDADLPGAVVARTRQPMFMRSLREIYQAFPQLEGYYPDERSLHIVPVVASERTLGLLAMTFRGGGLEQDSQTDFLTALAAALAMSLTALGAPSVG